MKKHTQPNQLSVTFRTCILAASFCAIGALGVSDAKAAPLAYDGFKIGGDGYTAGSLGGQNPTTLGFTGAWNQANIFGNGSAVVNSASALTYPSFTSDNTGGVATSSGGGSGVRVSRPLTNPFTTATAGTYYFSYLTQVPNTNKSGYVGLEMHSGGTDDSQRTFQAGYNQDVAPFSPTNITQWGIRVNNSTIASSTVNAEANTTALFVVKFTLSATNNSDSITLWVNPSDLSSEAGSGAGTTLSGLNFTADRIGFGDFFSDGGKFDELRVGTTFNDATTVVPEPGTVGLLMGGAGALLLRTRRRNQQPTA
jgi:hypothetical protein